MDIKITQEDLKEYLDKLLFIQRFPNESFFVPYHDERKAKRESKIGYELNMPIDAFKLDKIKEEIQDIKRKIMAYDKLDKENFVLVQSKMNYKPKF